MNVLTADIISLISSRNYSIVIHKMVNPWLMIIAYLDQNGKYHRINGPAIIYDDGDWYWYFHGSWHRDHPKPACKINKYYSWYNMGKFVTRRYN